MSWCVDFGVDCTCATANSLGQSCFHVSSLRLTTLSCFFFFFFTKTSFFFWNILCIYHIVSSGRVHITWSCLRFFSPALSLPFFGGFGFSLGVEFFFLYIWGRTHWCSFVELVGILYLAFEASEYNIWGRLETCLVWQKTCCRLYAIRMSRLSNRLLLLSREAFELPDVGNSFMLFRLSFRFLGAILFRICITPRADPPVIEDAHEPIMCFYAEEGGGVITYAPA